MLTSIEADVNEISRIVTDLVDNCTFNKLDINKLAHFDVEYLFLNIRAKSISETSDIIINCSCGEKIEHTIDLTKISVEKNKEISNKVMLSDSAGVILRYPKFDEMLDIHNSTSYSKQELNDFVNTFTKKQFDKLEEFFRKIPKVVQRIEKNCPTCGTNNVVDLEGIQNFFV